VSEIVTVLWRDADRFVRGRLAAVILLVVAASVLTALAPLVLKWLVDGFAGQARNALSPSSTPTKLSCWRRARLSSGVHTIPCCDKTVSTPRFGQRSRPDARSTGNHPSSREPKSAYLELAPCRLRIGLVDE
jgi:hypothetical protein